jgi:hypothetical protein
MIVDDKTQAWLDLSYVIELWYFYLIQLCPYQVKWI